MTVSSAGTAALPERLPGGGSTVSVVVAFYNRGIYRLKRGFSKIDEFYRICAGTFLGLVLAIFLNSFLLGPTFLNYFYLSSSVTLVQEEVRPDQRVMSGALLLLVMNLIGMGVGPTFVGAASDFFRAGHHSHSLQLAFYALLPFYGVAIGLFIWLARLLRNEAALYGAPR